MVTQCPLVAKILIFEKKKRLKLQNISKTRANLIKITSFLDSMHLIYPKLDQTNLATRKNFFFVAQCYRSSKEFL